MSLNSMFYTSYNHTDMFNFTGPAIHIEFNISSNLSSSDYIVGQTFLAKYSPVFIVNYSVPESPTMTMLIK